MAKTNGTNLRPSGLGRSAGAGSQALHGLPRDTGKPLGARLGPLALVAFVATTGGAWAQDLRLSGFASFVAGKTTGPCAATESLSDKHNDHCTRAIVDWSHGAVYSDKLSAAQESRLGLQADYALTRQLSATVQVTSRALDNQHANLEWAYLTWSPWPEWKLQVGRKRLPLYYYSDFQDVGFAYNTVRPSPEVYGWDLVNYNGISLSTTRSLGEWSVRAEAYAGSERSRENPYSTLWWSDPVEVKWGGIRGVAVEASKDWFTGRISYTKTRYQSRDQVSGELIELFDGSTQGTQDWVGVVLNGDWDRWQLRSELGRARRMDAVGFDARFGLVTLGRQWGAFTLTGGYSFYGESTRYAEYTRLRLRTTTLALRYDVHKGGALKLQFDRVRDGAETPLTGSSRMFSASYDLVF